MRKLLKNDLLTLSTISPNSLQQSTLWCLKKNLLIVFDLALLLY